MRPAAPALTILLLMAPIAGCLGGEEPDTTPTGGDALDEQSPPSDDAGGSGENEEATGEGKDSEEDSEAPDAAGSAGEGPRVEVAWFNGSVRGQSAPVFGPLCVETCDNQFAFAVSENTTGLVAELAWEAEASLLFDLDIPYGECEASTGEDCPPASTSGNEGYLEIRVTDPSDVVDGNWTASAWAEDSPTEAVDLTIAVSLFHGEIPRTYDKLAS